MRWFIFIFGSLAALCGPAAAQPDSLEQQFEAATAAYEQGQYAEAEETYRALLDSGVTNGALYYNLGNAYVRLDRTGQAIRYYEKARRLRPNDPRVQHNLEQAQRRAGVYPSRLPPRGLQGIVQGWSPLALFVAGGLLLGSGLVGAVVWTRPRRLDALRHPVVWGPVLAGLLLALAGMGTSYLQSLDARAVVVADQTSLYAAPGEKRAPDTTLTEGTLVEVRARRPEWTEVRLGDGHTGWVAAPTLGDV